jgi:hypothetical protein
VEILEFLLEAVGRAGEVAIYRAVSTPRLGVVDPVDQEQEA